MEITGVGAAEAEDLAGAKTTSEVATAVLVAAEAVLLTGALRLLVVVQQLTRVEMALVEDKIAVVQILAELVEQTLAAVVVLVVTQLVQAELVDQEL
jgi:hypothetical protein